MIRHAVFASSLACLLPCSASAQAWLEAPREVVPDLDDEIRAIADVDADGDLDLIVSRRRGISGVASLALFIAQPGGTFVPGARIAASVLGYEGDVFVLAGDVTGDGLPDLVTDLRDLSGTPGHGFLTYRNLGGGAFAAPLHTPALGIPWGGALTDYDGDGKQEVVEAHVAAASRGVQRWVFDGVRFRASNEVVLNDYLGGVAGGDVTGDGLGDVVVCAADTNRVYTIPSSAGGALGPPATHTVGVSNNLNGRRPACGDVDGDGDTDVVLAWVEGAAPGTSLIAVLRQSGGVLAAGVPQPFTVHPGGYSDGRPHLADWDGDGDLDVITSGEFILWFAGDGSGAFRHAGSIRAARRAGGQIAADGNEGAGAADFDGDGSADFACGRVVKYGDGSYPIAGDYPVGTVAHRAVDADRDGDLDILEAGGELLANDGAGRLASAGSQWPSAPAQHRYVQAHALGDFTGNGHADMLATFIRVGFPSSTFLGMRVLEGTADGRFVDRGQPTVAAVEVGDFWNFRFVQHDLDGDGDLDVAEIDGWWENAGNGFLPARHAAWSGRPVAAGDVDGDGLAEVVTFVASGDATTYLLQRNLGGSFAPFTLATENDAGARLGERPLLADLDGDGDLDFAAGTDLGGPAVLLRENVGGVFAPAVRLASTRLAWETLAADDFDGDGARDLFAGPFRTSGHAGDTVHVWRRRGPGLTYDSPRAYWFDWLSDAADLDGDGDLDFYGSNVFRGWRYRGGDVGLHEQYGAAIAVPGGLPPLIGLRGAPRVNEDVELRIRRGQGGGLAVLVLGGARAAVPNTPLPGLTLYASPVQSLAIVPLQGPAGVAGAGFLDIGFRVPAWLYSLTFHHQVFTLEAGGVGASNGLEVRYGR